tara:strand:+ start:624 stop:1001 length:378 start_codon:yes stop_codon:yes gene_type:complete
MKKSKEIQEIMIRHDEEIQNLIIRFINKYNGNTQEVNFEISEMTKLVKMFCVNYNELKYLVDVDTFTVEEFVNIVETFCCLIKNICCIYSINFKDESDFGDALSYFQESLSDILDETEKLYNITK